ncbi:MAG: MarR family winged helix-turn-helix transcriptional regulator [Bordetella sp.]|nr:MarR family winged helix-turn-helix transcriptional regulator [Bordetella sp.]
MSTVLPFNPPLDAGGSHLERLTSFRLRRLTNMYTKASASVYERQFDLTLNEWRVISLLDAAGSLSMLRLAEQAQFDRGMTSRIVGALIERGLVSRGADSRDARAAVLMLTSDGNGLVERIAPVAFDRNRQLLSCLTKKELELFEVALDKLTHQARVMLDLERDAAMRSQEARGA